jgi:hypothetical protein
MQSNRADSRLLGGLKIWPLLGSCGASLFETFEKHPLSPDFQPSQKRWLDKRRQARTKLGIFQRSLFKTNPD